MLNEDGTKAVQVSNLRTISAQGQGDLGDIIIHPNFAGTGPGKSVVYLSYVDRSTEDSELSGAAVERAVLSLSAT